MAPLLLGIPLAVSPVWQWNVGTSRDYAMDTCLELPEPLTLGAEADGTRTDRLELELVTRCEPATSDPGGWTLVCQLAGASLSAEALPSGSDGLLAALQDLDGRINGALAELVVDREGQVKRLDLHTDGPRKSAARTTLTLLVERAFLSLELTLPEGETRRWGESGAGLLSYLPRARSLGATHILHAATPDADGRTLHIQSAGQGVVRADAVTLANARGAPGALSLHMVLRSEADFDLQDGALGARQWTLLSRTTPDASFNAARMRHPYASAGTLRRLPAGESAAISESRLLTADHALDGQACRALNDARAALDEALDAPLTEPGGRAP